MTETLAPGALRLSRGRAEDRAYIIGLACDCFADFGDYAEIIAHWLDSSGAVSIVATRDDDRLGFAIVAPHRLFGFLRPRFAELVAIAVEKRARARGVGRCLLEHAELVARAWRAGEVRLHTARTNEAARRFFSRLGYHPLDAEPSYYPNGQVAIPMVRRLR